MNFFYCESIISPHIDNFLTKYYGNSIQSITFGNYICRYLHDEGSIFGLYTSDDYLLIYLGCITGIQDKHYFDPRHGPYDIAEHLMKAFRKTGITFYDNLNGDFSIAIIDKSNNDVYLINDCSANKPLFYCHKGNQLYFSSQLYPMHYRCLIDRKNEAFLLGFEFLPNDETFYKNVKKLPGGQLHIFHDSGRHSICGKKTNSKTAEFISTCPKNVVNQLYDIFMSVLEEQLSHFKETAVIMGGFDSALVASAIKRLGARVTTYTFRFQNQNYNQPYVTDVSDFLGSDHRWVDINQDVIRNGLSTFNLEFNYVASQPHYLIQTAHTVKQIREDGFYKAFTGDGCDGIFQGYPTVHFRAKINEQLSRIPTFLLNSLLYLFKINLFERYLGHPLRIVRNAVKLSTREMPMRAFIAARVFDEFALASLYAENNSTNIEKVEFILENLSKGFEYLPLLELVYLGKALPGLNKTKLDSCSKASGVAIFSPYLHPKLISFVRYLPKDSFRPSGHGGMLGAGKYILSRMAEDKGLLPYKIIFQKKRSPVNAPVDYWYKNDLGPFLLSLCQNLPFHFNSKYVDGLLPKRYSEALYRILKPSDAYTSHAICLLATYAQFAKL